MNFVQVATTHDGDYDVRVIAHVPKVRRNGLSDKILSFNTMFMANWSMSSSKRYLRAKKINLVLSTLMEEGWWL